jgi:hypothetical protein
MPQIFVQLSMCFIPLIPIPIMKAHKISEFKLPLARLAAARVPHAPGVYILYRTNMGQAAFVGRADHRLGEALDLHRRRGQYHYFKFMVCSDENDAFEWECMFWHQTERTIDNATRHPVPPHGSSVACPYPGCTHTLLTAATAPQEEFHSES